MQNKSELLMNVRQFAREKYAWPGGYPMMLVMSDGECLCADCTRANYRLISQSTRHNYRDGWQAAQVVIHWEGAPEPCANCNAEIKSAYGNPNDAK